MRSVEILCPFTRPSRLIHVRELFDCKDPLFFIMLHIFRGDGSEQTQVVFFHRSSLTEVPKLAGRAMFVQDKRWGLERRRCGPCMQGQDHWSKNVSALPLLYRVRDAIYG